MVSPWLISDCVLLPQGFDAGFVRSTCVCQMSLEYHPQRRSAGRSAVDGKLSAFALCAPTNVRETHANKEVNHCACVFLGGEGLKQEWYSLQLQYVILGEWLGDSSETVPRGPPPHSRRPFPLRVPRGHRRSPVSAPSSTRKC